MCRSWHGDDPTLGLPSLQTPLPSGQPSNFNVGSLSHMLGETSVEANSTVSPALTFNTSVWFAQAKLLRPQRTDVGAS
jgi:hypothetical protein